MHDPNLQLLEAAARLLEPLLDHVVFVGGCVTGLLITDPAAADMRPTTDVDVIAEAYSYAEYDVSSDSLRELGLTEDNREDAPTCRWRHGSLVIDVMPVDAAVLGFTNRWYQPAIESAEKVDLSGLTLRCITPVYFVATKLEAFHGRGDGDYFASHDLEDVIAVVDGRAVSTSLRQPGSAFTVATPRHRRVESTIDRAVVAAGQRPHAASCPGCRSWVVGHPGGSFSTAD